MENTRVIKYLLFFLAVGLTLVLFLWPSSREELLDLSSPREEIEEEFSDATASDVGSTRMVGPRFSGEDDKNRRWEISASEARQEGGLESQDVWLDDIQANASSDDGAITFEAGSGHYTQGSQTLVLEKGVVVEAEGFTLETEALKGNLEERSAKGEAPVKITGAGGELFANEFEITDNGGKVRLSGGVKGRFFPDQIEKMNKKPKKAVSETTVSSTHKVEDVKEEQ